MRSRRVVVTGMGCITSVGHDVDTFWASLLAGKSGVGRITLFPTEGFEVTIGAEVRNFDPSKYMEAKEVKRVDRFVQFALAAAHHAFQDSGLDMNREDRWRCGAIIGSGIGGLGELQDQHLRFLEKGPTRVSPFFVPKMMLNAAAGQVAIRLGLRGPNFGTASACASSNHAIGMAARTIQYNDADLMVTGGTEAALTNLGLCGFACMTALSKRNDAPEKASRPFDKDRDGFVMGEGCGMLVIEELEHARKRGARIYAEILGFGMSDDAHHITAPDDDGEGGAAAMRAALRDAGLAPTDIHYINAHGTSTLLNDRTETRAIKTVFGERARKIPISSSKSMIGHLLGAAAAVEIIAAIKSVESNTIHPTINYETPDPECDLDYTPNEKRRVEVRNAMSNSLGFGGHNSSVIVGKCV